MRNRFVVGLIGMALLSFAASPPIRPASAASAPARVVVRGVLVGQSGRPIPNVIVSFFGFPPGSNAGDPQSTCIATTDAQGRFTWSPPQGDAPFITQDHPLLDIYALPLDGGVGHVPNETLGPMSPQPAPLDLSPFGPLTRRCVQTWSNPGNDPALRLVVPDPGSAVLTIRGPDGKLAGSRPVSLIRCDIVGAEPGSAIVWKTTTRSDGTVSFRCFPDVVHLQVLMPGVGFGSTGLFEVDSNKTVDPELPRLIAFGSVSGHVDTSLYRAGSIVSLDTQFGGQSWRGVSAAVGADGMYRIDGVVAGMYTVVYDAGSGGPSQTKFVTVAPGQLRSGVDFVPRSAAGKVYFSSSTRKTVALNIHGRVVDQAGHPISGATVAALYYKYDPSRVEFANPDMLELVTTLRTGIDGNYQFEGLDTTQATIVAHDTGYAPEWQDTPRTPEVATTDISHSELDVAIPDLVLSNADDALTVHVLHGAAPAAGILVKIKPSGGLRLSSTPFFMSEMGAVPTVVAWFEPTAVTDAQGVAHFDDLAPGLWNAEAVNSDDRSALRTVGEESIFGQSGRANPVDTAEAVGIAVRRGETSDFDMRLAKLSRNVSPLILSPAGRIIDPTDVDWTVQRILESVSGPIGGVTTNGVTRVALNGSGIWRLTASSHRAERADAPLTDPPTRIGSIYIAASPALGAQTVPIIRTWRHGTATLRVHLTDDKGKPVRGSVLVLEPFMNTFAFGGSTDGDGEVTIHGLPVGQFEVAAIAAGVSSILDLPDSPGSFAPNPAHSREILFAPVTLTTQYDQTQDVTMAERPLGYLSGRVVLPNGARFRRLYVTASSDIPVPASGVVSPDGRFACGPMPAGKVRLYLEATSLRPDRMTETLESVSATFDPRRPSELALAPTADEIADAAKRPMPSAQQTARALRGMVLLPDGKTPAWGAQVAVIYPNLPNRPQAESTAPDGQIRPDSDALDYMFESASSGGAASSPIAVAWLPGSYGAVTAPFVAGKRLRMVLPAAMGIRGTVTVGGEFPKDSPSTFLVRAAYVGSPDLSQILSTEATVDANGSFVLNGLSAGTYVVQAARDGIWLSQSQTIRVAPGRSLKPIHLDIPLPGAPVVLHLHGADGMPLVGASVALDLPAGPLTSILWPKHLTADALGDLVVPGLSAGRHDAWYSAAPNGQSTAQPRKKITFMVAPLSSSGHTAETVRE